LIHPTACVCCVGLQAIIPVLRVSTWLELLLNEFSLSDLFNTKLLIS